MKGTFVTPVYSAQRVYKCHRRSHWFHTIMITRGELDRIFSNAAMKSRYVRCVLYVFFDMQTPHPLGLIVSRALECPWLTPLTLKTHKTFYGVSQML